MNNDPFDFATLAAYFDGQLAPAVAAKVEQWIAGEPDSAELRWLQAFHQHAADIVFPTLSDATRQQLIAQFEARQPAQPARPTVWQRLVAAVTFDSHDPQFATALRAAAGSTRQLQYSTPIVDIALDIAPQGERFAVSGQLLFNQPPTDEVCSVQLRQGDREHALTRTDAFGEFAITGVAAGAYELLVSHADFEIDLPDLTLA